MTCVRFMGIVYPGLGWARYRVRERHPMVFYDWGTWFGVTLWYVYVYAYPMVFYGWGTQGYGGGSVVWRGEGDLGAIGCVSIKTCHNSCRGIITEGGEWGGISTLWTTNFIMIRNVSRNIKCNIEPIANMKIMKTTNSPFSTQTVVFSEQSQPWKWQSL